MPTANNKLNNAVKTQSCTLKAINYINVHASQKILIYYQRKNHNILFIFSYFIKKFFYRRSINM